MGTDAKLLADERDIVRLALDYARGADTRNGDLFASAFAEDGELEYRGKTSKGTHQLSKIPSGLLAYEKTYHTILNHTIDVQGDAATGELYSASHHLKPIEANAYSDRVMYITYRDRYARTAQGWRIAYRLVDVQFVEYKPVQISD